MKVMAVDQGGLDASVEHPAWDWASLGRLVRRRTLEAVALHFATVAEMPCYDTSNGDSQCVNVESPP